MGTVSVVFYPPYEFQSTSYTLLQVSKHPGAVGGGLVTRYKYKYKRILLLLVLVVQFTRYKKNLDES